jgi:hypothetical protein
MTEESENDTENLDGVELTSLEDAEGFEEERRDYDKERVDAYPDDDEDLQELLEEQKAEAEVVHSLDSDTPSQAEKFYAKQFQDKWKDHQPSIDEDKPPLKIEGFDDIGDDEDDPTGAEAFREWAQDNDLTLSDQDISQALLQNMSSLGENQLGPDEESDMPEPETLLDRTYREFVYTDNTLITKVALSAASTYDVDIQDLEEGSGPLGAIDMPDIKSHLAEVLHE